MIIFNADATSHLGAFLHNRFLVNAQYLVTKRNLSTVIHWHTFCYLVNERQKKYKQ